MRTTLDIDADILKAAKVLAEAEHKTLGQVLSDLVRRGLTASASGAEVETQAGYDPGKGSPRHPEVGGMARNRRRR